MGTAILKRLWLGLLLLSACGPEPTPIAITPIISPTPIETAAPTLDSPMPDATAITYAVLPNAVDYIPANLENDPAITIARLSNPPSDDTPPYDLAIALGTVGGWQQSPIQMHIAAAFNNELPPLNNTALRTLLLQAIDVTALSDALEIPGVIVLHPPSADAGLTRTTLANLGYPDGLTITATTNDVPGGSPLIEQLATGGFALSVNTLGSTPAHITLLTWYQDTQRADLVERFGAANLVDLYAIPVSYLARPDLDITYTPEGWPIATR